MDDRAAFQVSIPGQITAPDVLGIWQPIPEPAVAVPGVEQEPVTVWRITLPEDPAQAAAALTRRRERLLLAQRAMPNAAQRLEAVALGVAGGESPAGSFAPPPAGEYMPERELQAWLESELGAEDYAGLKDLRAGLEQAAGQVVAFCEQVSRALTQFALVQTTAGERVLGHTRVAWLGDVHTLWGQDLALEQAALHNQSLALALASRQTWMRVLLLVAAGSARLSLLFASPLSIAASFKFLMQILDEIGQLRHRIVGGEYAHSKLFGSENHPFPVENG